MRIMWKFAVAIISKNKKTYTIITLIALSQLSILCWNNKRRETTLLVIFLIVRSEKRIKVFCCCCMQLCEEIQKLSPLYRSSACLQWHLTSKKKRRIHFKILLNIFYSWILLSKWIKFLIRVSELCTYFILLLKPNN